MKLGILEAMPREIFAIDNNISDSEKVINLLDSAGLSVDYDVYNVTVGELPPDVYRCDAYLVTGSIAGAYEAHDWIQPLREFLREAYTQHKKLVGICFGHQIIAQALGGTVARAETGYRIGLYKTYLEQMPSWMNYDADVYRVQYFHQDQVLTLPEKATKIASAEGCEFAMYHIGNQVFCMQGHPEQPRRAMRNFLNSIHDELPAALVQSAEQSIMTGEADDLQFAIWIKEFLEQK